MEWKSRLLDYLLLIVCNSGLFYQTYILISNYLNGHTVVNVKIGRIVNETIPAITVCYPGLISFEKASRTNPEWLKEYGEYMSLVNKFQHPGSNITEYEFKESLKIFQNYYRSITKKILSDPAMSELKILEDLSFDIQGDHFEREIKTIIHGHILSSNASNLGLVNLHGILHAYTGPYVQSVTVIIEDQLRKRLCKCFTMFSFLDNSWRNQKIFLEQINVKISMNYTWFPPGEDNIILILHSAHRMPYEKFDQFTPIKPNSLYEVSYGRIEKDLLGEGYDTHCRNYNLDNSWLNQSMRIECIASCIKDKMSCHYGVMLRKENFNDYEGQRLLDCHYYLNYYENAYRKIECYDICPVECVTNDYRFDIKHNHQLEYQNLDLKGETHIVIQHNGIDEEIIHLPQIDLMSLVCNFGGLLGLWLGISILAIFRNSISTIKNFFADNNTITNSVIILPGRITNYNFYKRKPKREKQASLFSSDNLPNRRRHTVELHSKRT